MKLTIKEIQLILESLSYAQNYLYNDLDSICDDEYRKDAENVLENINKSINILENNLYNKQNSR